MKLWSVTFGVFSAVLFCLGDWLAVVVAFPYAWAAYDMWPKEEK